MEKPVIVTDWHGVLDKTTFAKFNEMLKSLFSPEFDKPEYEKKLKSLAYSWVVNEDVDFWKEIKSVFELNNEQLEALKSYILRIDLNKEVYKIYSSLINQGYKVIILSDCPAEKAKKIVSSKYFKQVPMYFSCDCNSAKDNEYFFINFLQEQELYPDNCLYIDDNEEPIIMAEILGFKTHLFDGDVSSLEKAITNF